MNSGRDNMAILRDIASEKKVRPKAPPTYRRRAALMLGLVFGLAYALLSQFTNSILTPSVPFAHYPFGAVGNTLVDIVGIGLVCLICALPEDEYRGALFASLTAMLIIDAPALLSGSTGLLLMLASPRALLIILGLILELGLSLPFMILLRWALDIQHELYGQGFWSWNRLRLPLGLLVAVSVLGLLSVYPEDVRQDMVVTNDMIVQARLATGPGALPAPLKHEAAPDILHNVRAQYALEQGDSALMEDDLPLGFLGSPVVIIARFRGGWTLACLFADTKSQPVCKSFELSQAPPIDDARASEPGA